jgi:hypothetical protein
MERAKCPESANRIVNTLGFVWQGQLQLRQSRPVGRPVRNMSENSRLDPDFLVGRWMTGTPPVS